MDFVNVVVKPFIKVTIECFDSMMGIPLKFKEIKTVTSRHKENGVYALIGFTGDMEGMIAISIPDKAARNVIGRFIGENIEQIDEDAIDAVGEIINIIAGAKRNITGYNLTMSLPSVMYGSPLMVALPRNVPVISTSFLGAKEDLGEIVLFVCLKPLKG